MRRHRVGSHTAWSLRVLVCCLFFVISPLDGSDIVEQGADTDPKQYTSTSVRGTTLRMLTSFNSYFYSGFFLMTRVYSTSFAVLLIFLCCYFSC